MVGSSSISRLENCLIREIYYGSAYCEDKEGIARHALTDGRVQADDEVHLALGGVRQEEQPHHGCVRNFIVARLSVKAEEGREELKRLAGGA